MENEQQGTTEWSRGQEKHTRLAVAASGPWETDTRNATDNKLFSNNLLHVWIYMYVSIIQNSIAMHLIMITACMYRTYMYM